MISLPHSPCVRNLLDSGLFLNNFILTHLPLRDLLPGEGRSRIAVFCLETANPTNRSPLEPLLLQEKRMLRSAQAKRPCCHIYVPRGCYFSQVRKCLNQNRWTEMSSQVQLKCPFSISSFSVDLTQVMDFVFFLLYRL